MSLQRKATRVTQPKKVVENLDEVQGLPDSIRTNIHGARFLYVHYAFGWEFVDDDKVLSDGNGWLPVLSEIKGVAGANGVVEDGKRVIMTKAVAAAMEKGGIVIDPKDPRLGPYQHYVCSYDLRGGGKYFVNSFQEATVLPTDVVLWNGDDVAPEWNKFRAHLRDHILEPMMPEVYKQKLDVERQLLTSLEDRAASASILEGRAKRQAHRIAKAEAAWAAWQSKIEPEPTKPAKKPSKKVDDEVAA
jgi:hypothetical protein